MGIEEFVPQSATDIFNRQAADVVSVLEDLDPFTRNSLIRAIITGSSNEFFEFYNTLLTLQNLIFWDTTTGQSLERNAAIFGIARNPASIATGNVTFTGIDTTFIPSGTSFTSETGNVYETVDAGTISATTLTITDLISVGGIATATTSIDHGLATNNEVVISGANEAEYNGTFIIVVLSETEFQYTITGTPASPATGTPVADATYINLNAQSVDFGSSQNLVSGSSINLSPPIAGVDTTNYVSFDEIDGGTDIESDDSLRERFLLRVQNPVSQFNVNSIINPARS